MKTFTENPKNNLGSNSQNMLFHSPAASEKLYCTLHPSNICADGWGSCSRDLPSQVRNVCTDVKRFAKDGWWDCSMEKTQI